MNRVITTMTGVLLLTGLFGMLVFFPAQRTPDVLEDSTEQLAAAQERIPPPGRRLYWNDTYQFSLFYPEGYRIDEVIESNRAITVTIEDWVRGSGVQVYVLPYTEEKITDAQFMLDVPSGIRINERTAKVGGVEAVYFESEDIALGETIEIWFINYGYLYELTAPKADHALIEQVAADWRFF